MQIVHFIPFYSGRRIYSHEDSSIYSGRKIEILQITPFAKKQFIQIVHFVIISNKQI